MLLWAKQPSPPHLPPKNETILSGNSWFAFYRPSQFGIWTVFAFPSQTAFQYVRLLKRRQAATREERCTSLALPELGALLYLFKTEV